MKKVIISIFLIVICYLGFGQTPFPIQQNLGSGSTLVKNPNYGGLQGGLIPYTFADTTAANTALTYLKNYCGAIIYCTDVAALFYRSCYAGVGGYRWVMISPSGIPSSSNSYLLYGNSGLFTSASGDVPFGFTVPNYGIDFTTNNTSRFILDRTGILAESGTTVGLGYDPSNGNKLTQFSGSGGSIPISSLTAATGTNSINNANYAQVWNWDSFDGDGINGLGLLANTTATIDGSDGLFAVAVSGANAASGVTSKSAVFRNSHTGTTSTNIAASFEASGGSNNYAIIVPANNGSVGIGNSAPSSLLSLGTAGSQLGTLSMAGNTSGTITIQPQAAAGTYNFNLPQTAGTSGYLLTSAGGAGSPMTWTDPTPYTAVPTWQQTLTAGSTLTGTNTIDGDGNSIYFENLSDIHFEAVGIPSVTAPFMEFISTNATTNRESSIDIQDDSINIKPSLGQIHIDTLNYSDAADDSMVVWSAANNGALAMRAIPSGGSGANTALSNLASVAINESLISDANNTDDLGSASIAWRTAYLGTSMGIGTTPSTALHVVGTTRIGSTATQVMDLSTSYISGSNSFPFGYLNVGAAGTSPTTSLFQLAPAYTGNPSTMNFFIGNKGGNYTAGYRFQVIVPTFASGNPVTLSTSYSSGGSIWEDIAIGGSGTEASANLYVESNGNVGIGVNNTTPTSILHTNGSFATAYAATATSTTLTIAHQVMAVTATGQTITLPTAVGITGRIYTIKLTASGTGTVDTTSSQTIDGVTTYSLSAQYKYVTVQSDGANWNIIANN